MLLLHLSDPHFGTETAAVVQALLKLAHARRPGVFVLSGDLTQRATGSEFAAARAFIDALPAVPRVVVPGNHDLPLYNMLSRTLSPYGGYRAAIGEDLAPVFDHARLQVTGLNTTRVWRHSNGEVSRRQIGSVAARLAQGPADAWRVVVTHQPVAVTHESDRADLLRGADAAVAAWAAAGADLVLGGHIHLPYVLPLHERPPGLSRRMWAVQAGTSVSRRIRRNAPNSVNFIDFGAEQSDRAVAERWDYDDSIGAFREVEHHDLQRSPVKSEPAAAHGA